MPIKEINNTNIFYELMGDGKEVIAFFNGIAMQTALWQSQVNAVKDNYQVLLHDFRGQGQSSLEISNFTFKQHADDFYELLNKLEIDKVHIVGVSYGAEVAMQFALKYPSKISSLILGTAVSEIKPLLKAMAEAWISAAQTYDGELFFKVMSPFVYSNTFYENKGEWLNQRAKIFGDTVTKEWMDAFAELCKNFLTLDLTDQLHKIKIPTLVVSGEKDILKPASYGKLINQELPDSEFVVVDDAAHGLFAEKPEE
ncbi:MAG: alpha/beta fold hydrolase, partial [Bacillota bacterium]